MSRKPERTSLPNDVVVERDRKGGMLTMEQQTVEVKFHGEQAGSHSGKDAAYTLYGVGDDLYVVHVEEGNAS
jgi:hypothetical protein